MTSITTLKTKRIFLWSAPRSMSTAFQLSVGNLPEVKSIFEPYTPPYYRSKPLKVMPESAPLYYSFEEADKMIQAEYEGKNAVFVKDFPYNHQGRYEVFLDEGFKDCTHTFLIRNPQRAVPSFYKALGYNLETFLELDERGDVGFICLYNFYSFLKSRLGINPLIIDADDLLVKPEQMMEAYCKSVGLTYREGMTKWEPWPQPGSMWHELKDQDFFIFPPENHVWVGNAIKSSGFTPSQPLQPVTVSDDLPSEVKKCIEESSAVYNKLYRLRMTL